MASRILWVISIIVGLAAVVLLYLYNPSESALFPKCPFFMLTGYKCPGCGTLRGLHALLHGNIIEALRLNAFMVLCIPVLFLITFSQRIRKNATFSKVLLGTVILWWIIRNFPLGI